MTARVILGLACLALIVTTGASALGGILPPRLSWSRLLWRIGVIAGLGAGVYAGNLSLSVPLGFAGMAAGFAIAWLAVAVAGHDGTSEASAGSLMRRAAASRAPFGLGVGLTGVGTVAAVDAFRANGTERSLAITLLVLGLGTLVFGWIRGARVAVELLDLAKDTRPAEPSKVPALRIVDVGVGDATWISGETPGAPYRDGGVAGVVVKGDVIGASRALVGRLIRRAPVVAVAALACGAALTEDSAPNPPHQHTWEAAARPTPPAPKKPAWTPETRTYLSFYPQPGPIVEDINGDGVEDLIGLRWDASHENAALMVVANDGRDFRQIWATPGFPSQWYSPTTHLVRSGDRLFLTDSEGMLRVIDLRSGAILNASPVPAAKLACPAGDDPPAVYLQTDWGFEKGLRIDVTGAQKPAPRPRDCESWDRIPACPAKGGVVCHAPTWPAWLNREAQYASVEQQGDVGIIVGAAKVYDPKHKGPAPKMLWGYDPKTQAKRFAVPLPFADEELHAEPHLEHTFAGGRVFAYYQLKNGSWQVGARDGKTGEVLWRRSPPRAQLGTHFQSMTATAARLYVAFDLRLEVFDAVTGSSLGVVW
jgi:hypothetical protein